MSDLDLLAALLDYCDAPREHDGEVISFAVKADYTGEEYAVALIDYGIKGTKKFKAPLAKLVQPAAEEAAESEEPEADAEGAEEPAEVGDEVEGEEPAEVEAEVGAEGNCEAEEADE